MSSPNLSHQPAIGLPSQSPTVPDQQAFLADLLATSLDHIYIKDRDSRFLLVNSEMARLLACTPENAVGKTDFDFFGEEHARKAFEDEQRIMKTGVGVVAQEERETWADGSVTWVSSTKVARRNAKGEVIGIIGISRDITDRKKLEQQFLRQQRMEGIGTLAGGIAHDLNNVLAPILISIAMLKAEESNSQKLNILAAIEKSAQRGADLIQQVLSFARGVDGQRVCVSVKNILRDIIGIANDTFLKNIRVEFDIPKELWNLTGDPTQIHQVFLNLCINARDAMPRGGTILITARNEILDEVSASYEAEPESGPYVVIRVVDTGCGMRPEVLNKIFEPFFTTKELGKGTGLGLSTTLGIVKSHGGFIRVESQFGHGTSFSVYLPANQEEDSEQVAQEDEPSPSGNGEVILVVDDEEPLRKITAQTLETFGYRVLVAADGAEAVSIYAAHKSDIALVITDMMMPVMDGIATIQVLRKMNQALPIIAVSGLATCERIADSREFGVNHFLPKPYSAHTLLTAISHALRREN